MELTWFTFNDFAENTYILWDKTLECVIVDPGCNTTKEKDELTSFIRNKNLKPVRLINTHCHIDHVLGNRYISDLYALSLEAHRKEEPVLMSCIPVSQMYRIPYEPSPPITVFHEEGDALTFGETHLEILFTPGHSPGSISLYNRQDKILIAGDALFYNSIGRTDLPGGDHQTLIQAIKDKIFTLDGDTVVYPGHGPKTSVDFEKATNPFFD